MQSPHVPVCNQTGSADTERMVRLPNMTVHPPNGQCSHQTGLFAQQTSGALTAHGCSPTEQVVQSPHLAVRLWSLHMAVPHRTVRSPYMAVCLLNRSVCPPNGWCSTAHGCLLTEWVVQSLYMAVCSLQTGGAATVRGCLPQLGGAETYTVRPQNRRCSHCT